MKDTLIQWTDATWNVARGCTKVDEDCKFCYMYRDSMDSTRYNPLDVIRTKTVFNFPLKYKETKSKVWSGKPLIFTSSLTDFFHPAIDSYRAEAWDIIRKCPHLIFQILTKRPERIIEHLPEFWEEIRGRVWLGTSVGSNAGIQRFFDLIVPIQPGIKFLSLEPMHGEIDLQLNGGVDMSACVGDLIDWIIVGGESGNDSGKYRYRPCKLEWIGDIIRQVDDFGFKSDGNKIAVFIKQLGTHLSKELKMSDRHGGNINEFPKYLQIREFPFEIIQNPLTKS